MNATHELVIELRHRVEAHCAKHGIPIPKPSHPIRFRPRIRLRPDVHNLVTAEFAAEYFWGAIEKETVVAVMGFPVTRGPKAWDETGPEFQIER